MQIDTVVLRLFTATAVINFQNKKHYFHLEKGYSSTFSTSSLVT